MMPGRRTAVPEIADDAPLGSRARAMSAAPRSSSDHPRCAALGRRRSSQRARGVAGAASRRPARARAAEVPGRLAGVDGAASGRSRPCSRRRPRVTARRCAGPGLRACRPAAVSPSSTSRLISASRATTSCAEPLGGVGQESKRLGIDRRRGTASRRMRSAPASRRRERARGRRAPALRSAARCRRAPARAPPARVRSTSRSSRTLGARQVDAPDGDLDPGVGRRGRQASVKRAERAVELAVPASASAMATRRPDLAIARPERLQLQHLVDAAGLRAR